MKNRFILHFYEAVKKQCTALKDSEFDMMVNGISIGIFVVTLNSLSTLSFCYGDTLNFFIKLLIASVFTALSSLFNVAVISSFWDIPKEKYAFPLMIAEILVQTAVSFVYIFLPLKACAGNGADPWSFDVMYPAVLRTVLYLLTYFLFFFFGVFALIEDEEEQNKKQNQP